MRFTLASICRRGVGKQNDAFASNKTLRSRGITNNETVEEGKGIAYRVRRRKHNVVEVRLDYRALGLHHVSLRRQRTIRIGTSQLALGP